MNAALPAPGAWCASAALYCACAFAHAPALNAALPASFAAVSARSLFRPRAAAAQSGSRRSACEDELSYQEVPFNGPMLPVRPPCLMPVVAWTCTTGLCRSQAIAKTLQPKLRVT